MVEKESCKKKNYVVERFEDNSSQKVIKASDSQHNFLV